jgi:ubiquinone/menaquinone biosynthesis C-methylase UbiE
MYKMKSQDKISKSERIRTEKEHYDKTYSKIRSISGWRLYEFDFFKKYIKELEGKSMIEIGCGQGDAIKELSIKAGLKRVIYTGIDISKEGVRKGRENYPKGTFSVGDCSALDYPDRKFDSALCLGVLHHLPNPEEGLIEMLRVVKRGGIILIREPSEKSFRKGDSPYERGLNMKRIFELIEESGGKVESHQKINTLPIKAFGHVIYKVGLEKFMPRSYWKIRIWFDKVISKISGNSIFAGVDHMIVVRKIK